MKIPLLAPLVFLGLPLLSLLARENAEAASATPPAQVSPAAGCRDSDAAQKKNSSTSTAGTPSAPTTRNQSARPKHLFM